MIEEKISREAMESTTEQCDNSDLPKKKINVVETSPHGRFVRFNEKLGEGSFKKVYRAWDTKNGVEVAWNSVSGASLNGNSSGKRVIQEMKILQQLQHPYIIKFFGSWLNKEAYNVVFVTELITGGSLKEFVSTRPVRLNILKRWCRDILSALSYLHSHEPPIIHRDLKCDNIFINGCTGDIRIGDLGLASWHRSRTHPQSILGTPEYMAPELYNEVYDEQVDVYAFGMCVLEMVTKEVPYSECSSAPQIFRKVTCGVLPTILERFQPGEVRDYIEKCITLPEEGMRRPSADELQRDPFLDIDGNHGNDSQIDCLTLLSPEPTGDAVQPGRSTQKNTPVPTDNVQPARYPQNVKRVVATAPADVQQNDTTESMPKESTRRPAFPRANATDNPTVTRELSPVSTTSSSSFPVDASSLIEEVESSHTTERQSHATAISSVRSLSPIAQSDWKCIAKRCSSDDDVLNIILRLKNGTNKISIDFDFNIYESPEETVQEMINEKCLPEDFSATDINALRQQLDRFRIRFKQATNDEASQVKKLDLGESETNIRERMSSTTSLPQPSVRERTTSPRGESEQSPRARKSSTVSLPQTNTLTAKGDNTLVRQASTTSLPQPSTRTTEVDNTLVQKASAAPLPQPSTLASKGEIKPNMLVRQASTASLPRASTLVRTLSSNSRGEPRTRTRKSSTTSLPQDIVNTPQPNDAQIETSTTVPPRPPGKLFRSCSNPEILLSHHAESRDERVPANRQSTKNIKGKTKRLNNLQKQEELLLLERKLESKLFVPNNPPPKKPPLKKIGPCSSTAGSVHNLQLEKPECKGRPPMVACLQK
mmetsp:Transcript_11256/g.20913  ORF Transcript_11256/g.20913 Transcript_11256/m.20913 type:complete len:825 (-) Transcript_11256:824-3298(-)|eukprot:CAMPEP_0203747996 /NCGR_PEP_ID=MMETSP0098-20131031/2988_1 /ASSEMBLY_ACC=CAM_ASM_000208 /TAXON_ID=96639 /ORGANISM=" , Strain NY0313808BC1" /LENGTH=824 /DNA_ID=CAMNT_0050636601 /DNA_START=659 /DNA_END=3133 /DNA_ORIENTATION=+